MKQINAEGGGRRGERKPEGGTAFFDISELAQVSREKIEENKPAEVAVLDDLGSSDGFLSGNHDVIHVLCNKNLFYYIEF